MDYISSLEAAAKWGVSLRCVQRLLAQGRVAGAQRHSNGWLVPADAAKPDDPRRVRKSGCPPLPACSIIPVLYLHGGDEAKALARCKSEGERELLRADLAYFRGDADAARAIAAKLYAAAELPQLKLGAGMILALCTLALGDALVWKELLPELASIEVPPGLQMEKDCAIGALNAGLHSHKSYPKWLETGAFTGLSPELFPAARWIYVSILYVKWKELDLLAVAEPLIAECRREGSGLCEIYLRLLAATAYADHGNAERAREHITRAAELAMPSGLIEPFIEYRRQLLGLMDSCLKAKYPQALSEIKKRMQPFLDGWTKVYNSVWQKSIADKLTPREFEACLLYARGMVAVEMAFRMGVSVNTVRKYLSSAYNKLGIEEKEQLRQLIHT